MTIHPSTQFHDVQRTLEIAHTHDVIAEAATTKAEAALQAAQEAYERAQEERRTTREAVRSAERAYRAVLANLMALNEEAETP